MKITLVEECGGVKFAERSFESEIVRIGRDPENCEIVFEQRAFPMVSRRHAELRDKNGRCLLVDTNSSFGTYLNGHRINTPTDVQNGALIQFGINGPALRVSRLEVKSPTSIAEAEFAKPSNATSAPSLPQTAGLPATLLGAKIDFGEISAKSNSQNTPQNPQLLLKIAFDSKNELIVGRGAGNDIRLEGLQISKRHARLIKTGANVIAIEDTNSTNGVFFQGRRITGRQILTARDTAQIGAFQIRVDESGQILVFDTRSKTSLDGLHLTKIVRNTDGSGDLKLLDDVSIAIQPNEFVGLLGPSGAGKSTLMDALNGMRPPTSGNVFFNNLDFYANLNALKQSVGYVPQEDIIHRELSVYRTLYYIAKLRLSKDASAAEIEQIISEVLDATDLTDRRDVCVSDLSGGQRKRVSIAVELLTRPSVIFLDEPTSGLDPATADRIMKLFRRIAESGRTIILTTHAMENVRLFDKVAILMRGKLVFYGTPAEALKHTGAENFRELYDKLEEPIEQKLNQLAADRVQIKKHRNQITEQVAEELKQKFLRTAQYRRNIYEPLSDLLKKSEAEKPKRPPKRRLGIFGAIRQTATLTIRYAAVLAKDRINLTILLLQAPIIAVMTAVVLGAKQPRDFAYFVLSLVAVWFGTSVAAREIVRERAVFKRERMVNLGLTPYLVSKLIVLGFIVTLQCLLLFVPLKFFDLTGIMPMPGEFGGLPQLIVMIATAFVGLSLGLLVSALVKTSEMATSLVPLILIPQILFSGLVGVPNTAAKIVGLTMPAAWSFDAMKRFSGLDTLEKEGSDPRGANEGEGLYKAIERRNEDKFDEYERRLKSYYADENQGIKTEKPKKPHVEKLSEMDLSQYIGFLNDWMRTGLNEFVLLTMFLSFLFLTLSVLRSQDIR
jgi:ABC-type multidrug transport system ATPase subunit/pSer/pThr/pTyr-binding forkhead associated (FHA) protein